MLLNDVRRDYLLDRWVVIATARRKRPTDFISKREVRRESKCPFCPGNEHMTPPATLVYLSSRGSILKETEHGDTRFRDWLIRCVPNLYPAFSPPGEDVDLEVDDSGSGCVRRAAVGHHEVLIESPIHDEHLGSARIIQLIHVINACIDRYRYLSSRPYVKYVSIFRNYGADAGASLSHAHTQIMAVPFIPKIVSEELGSSRRFWSVNEECIFCNVIKMEMDGPRFVWANKSFVVFAPWASVHPFEFWIAPREHQNIISEMDEGEIRDLAEAMRVCFGGLKRLLNDPSYNLGFHMACREYYHWHIEVYPRLAIWAGFEKSTGTYINVVSPEDAASNLREAFQEEEEIIHSDSPS